jgi:2-polyprenyl-3-methyl-5-hydroxy-6-metoxy-1,4-benzoquinol methylase
VVLSNVLEHAPDPKKVLINLRGSLKPGCQICISSPNSRSWLRKVFGRSSDLLSFLWCAFRTDVAADCLVVTAKSMNHADSN